MGIILGLMVSDAELLHRDEVMNEQCFESTDVKQLKTSEIFKVFLSG